MKRIISWTVAGLLLGGLFARMLTAEEPAAQSTTAPPAQRITLYAAVVKPGPVWKANLDRGQRNDMAAHIVYVTKMRADGKLILGGPFSDGTGGLLVYRADSLEAAQTMMNDDPAVIDKVFDAELHPWSVNAADVSPK